MKLVKQHFALTLHHNPTNWTGRDSVVAMCLPWMADHIIIACTCVNYCQNEWFRDDCKISWNDHVTITASVYFLSCCIQICPKWKKCCMVICAICKKRFKSNLQYTAFYQTCRNALDQTWSWTVTAEYEAPVGLQWVCIKGLEKLLNM